MARDILSELEKEKAKHNRSVYENEANRIARRTQDSLSSSKDLRNASLIRTKRSSRDVSSKSKPVAGLFTKAVSKQLDVHLNKSEYDQKHPKLSGGITLGEKKDQWLGQEMELFRHGNRGAECEKIEKEKDAVCCKTTHHSWRPMVVFPDLCSERRSSW